MPNRSWATEYFARTLRQLFLQANERSLAWLRVQIDQSIVPSMALAKVSSVKRQVGGIDVRMVRPKAGGTEDTVIIYFHGGGYVFGSSKSHLGVIAQLAVDANCLVIAPDYRLAPEHAFPASQDDCVAVAVAVAKAYPNSQLVLAGDSAGGALAVTVALELEAELRTHQANDESGQTAAVDRLVLLSPWVDPLAVGGSMQSNAANDFLIGPFLQRSYQALMQEHATSSSRVSVIDADLATLPPTLIQCGEGELFFDQIQEFSARAKKAGVEVTLSNYQGQFHVFQTLSPILKDARRAMREIAHFIRGQ